MALADAVKNSKNPSQLITWKDQDGDVFVLTGATITAQIKRGGGTSIASDGTFTVTDAANGIFRWDYSTADVAEDGLHEVQFNAAFGSGQTPAKSFSEYWRVRKEI